ncbi:potassium channel family protein [Litoreibacter janthinus]|uniref:Ion channel n=1 Tax=Litoreibacter janthinus TaxID=670154 RepID=A0A1I6HC54_9RHOB|nr:potassium channel family protein [Litoreibacter janthinus]SFR52052.1 Ion channel [Litoreibacter janthinus]
MIKALFVGSVVIVITMLAAAMLFEIAGRALRRVDAALERKSRALQTLAVLVIALFWILLVLTLSIWGWAGVFMYIGLFDRLETALYFAIVSFTTVGYGDVVIDENWRLLAGMTATNGLLVFGLFTAFLVEILDVVRFRQR